MTVDLRKVKPMTWAEWKAALEAGLEQRRHGGPGPHKNGTPQSVHGANFGDTVSPVDGRRPTTGFQVGQPGGSMIVSRAEWKKDGGVAAGKAFLERNREVFKSDPDVFMGVWLDKAKQEIDLDVSHNIQSLDAAKAQARIWDQQAIWDNANGRVIMVGGSGAREHAEGGRSTSSGLLGLERRGEGGLGEGAVRRGALRRVDAEVVEALDDFWRRYDADQPRVPKGQAGGGRFGSKGEGRIGVHTGTREDLAPKNQAAGNAKLVDEATTFAAIEKADAKLAGKIRAGVDKLGVTDADMDANITAVLDRAEKLHGRPAPGQDWYEEAHGAADELTRINPDLHIEQGSGIVAALSPQQAWGDNVAGAQYVARSLQDDDYVQVDLLESIRITKEGFSGSALDWAMSESAGRSFDGKVSTPPSRQQLAKKRLSDLDPYTAAAIVKAHAQAGYKTKDGKKLSTIDDLTGLPTPVRWTCGVTHIGRAVRIGRGETPNRVLGGHKVRSFYNNILDPNNDYNDVTVDSHAFSVAMGKKFGSGSTEYGFFSGFKKFDGMTAPASAPLGVRGLYSAYADAYRRVGAARKPPMSARQVQAITWIQWRKDHPDKTRGAQLAKGESAE